MITRTRPMLRLQMICSMIAYSMHGPFAKRIHTKESRELDRVSSIGPRNKGGKAGKHHTKDKSTLGQGKTKNDQDKFPLVSIDDLAAHDLDTWELQHMAESYLRTQAPAHPAKDSARCCCKFDYNGKVGCEVMRGSELEKRRNPLRASGATCPVSKGYHKWNNERFSLKEFPNACLEVDLNEVVRTIVPDKRRTHEAMIVAEASLARGMGPEAIAASSGSCCCKVDPDPAEINCQIMAIEDLEDKRHCPWSEGYHSWNSKYQSFSLSELPEKCRLSGIDRYMKKAPRDFAISALVASSALFQTRFALDPAASYILKAQLQVVRRRLSDVMEMLDKSISSVRQSQETTDNRGKWIGAEFIYAVAGGSIQRALRLLTPVSKLSMSDANSSHSALESDSNFMREFAGDGLYVYNADSGRRSSNFTCERLGTTNHWLRAAVFSAAWLQEEGLCNVSKIQQTLRKWGAWWHPIVRIKGNAAAAKKEWATRWSQIRSSLDFTPWPASPTQEEMVVPSICETEYLMGDETARFPKLLGGSPIMHTFLVFAGSGASPRRPGCLDTAKKMAELFPQLSSRRKVNRAMKEYIELLRTSNRLGCHGLLPLGRAWLAVTSTLEENLETLRNFTFKFKMTKTKQNKTFEIKLQRISDKRQSVKRKEHVELHSSVIRWVSHTIIKYAAKTGSDDWLEEVENSLRKAPPSMSAHDLSASFWQQLSVQGISSPYDETHCPNTTLPECGDWSKGADDHWESAKLDGSTLEAVIGIAKKVHAVVREGDWRLLAQTPAAYGAVGFDSPGIVDNSDWECTRTTNTCPVHPRCARAAAQMLSHSFMTKPYASDWTRKARTYLNSDGSFDRDGFHSYCHTSAGAYCWSYTECLKQMLNWLCAQAETAEQCCPDQAVAAACRKDVNSEECNVCKPTSDNTSQQDPINAEVPTVDTFYLMNMQKGRCVHTLGPKANKGGQLVYYDECNGEKNQFDKVEAGEGMFYLRNVQTGLCVHTVGATAYNGGEMTFWDECSGEKNKFDKVDAGGDAFYLRNVQTGRCVHTVGASAKNGGKMVYWDGCSGEKNIFQEKSTPKVQVVQTPAVSKKTLAWLRPGLAEAAEKKCETCVAVRRLDMDEPVWGLVSTLPECRHKEEDCRELCGLSHDDDDDDSDNDDDELSSCMGWESRCAAAGC